MKDHQTPQKEHSRQSGGRSKETPLKKVAKKSLNASFRSVSADFSPEVTKEPANFSPEVTKELSDFSPISEVSSVFEIAESCEKTPNPAISASLEPFTLSDITPSSTITVKTSEFSSVSADHYGFNKSDGSSIIATSVEVDVVVNHLKQARLQVLNSVDVDTNSKKLLDALIKIVVEDFYTMPEEKDRFTELVSRKSSIVFMCLLIWILAMSVIFFLRSGSRSSYTGPVPT